MNEDDTTESSIESALRECETQIQTRSWGTEKLNEHFPLTESTLHDLNPEQTARMDQFIYRFTKLQDAMARRLFPALYTYFVTDNEPLPFLDILNRLEQLGIIASTQTWQELADMFRSAQQGYRSRSRR